MAKLILTRGLPGSGKTTWAMNWVNEDLFSRVRVNRDNILRMVSTCYVFMNTELVRDILYSSVELALKHGKDVVLDGVNLNNTERYLDIAKKYNATVEYKDFKVSLEECLKRNKKRPEDEIIPEELIRCIYENNKDFFK